MHVTFGGLSLVCLLGGLLFLSPMLLLAALVFFALKQFGVKEPWNKDNGQGTAAS